MATRFYLPSTGATVPLSPPTPSGWNNTGAAGTPQKMVTSKTSSAMTSIQVSADSTSGDRTHLCRQYVSAPLSGQTISGTIKGQIRAIESSTQFNGTAAIKVYLMKPDGTVRSTLLNITYSDVTSGNPEFATSLTNTKFTDSSENASISLTSQTATGGDYLVVEIGIRENGTTTSRTGSLNFGDNSATDLGENFTDTSAYNPWIEFSTTLSFATQYTKSVDVVSSCTVTNTPATKKAQVVPVTMSSTTNLKAIRNPYIAILAETITTLTNKKAVSQNIPIVASTTTTLLRGIKKELPIVMSSITTLTPSKLYSKTIDTIASTITTLTKKPLISIPITMSSITTLTNQKQLLQTIPTTMNSTISLTYIKNLLLPIVMTSNTTTTLTRNIQKEIPITSNTTTTLTNTLQKLQNIDITSNTTTNLSKSIGKFFDIVSNSIVELNEDKTGGATTKYQTIDVVSNNIPELTKRLSLSKDVDITLNGIPELTKKLSLSKEVDVTSSNVVVLDTLNVQNQEISITSNNITNLETTPHKHMDIIMDSDVNLESSKSFFKDINTVMNSIVSLTFGGREFYKNIDVVGSFIVRMRVRLNPVNYIFLPIFRKVDDDVIFIKNKSIAVKDSIKTFVVEIKKIIEEMVIFK